KLAAILKYHVVSGSVKAGDALNAGSADTLQGGSVEFSIQDGLLKANDATIKTVNLDGGNGVIHVIDSVLMPPVDSEKEMNTSERTSGDPVDAITAAVSKGVPAFNSGDAEACAKIYRNCIESLSSSEKLDQHLRKALSRVLEMEGRYSSDVELAWYYRKALDATLISLSH
ncbi:MAG: fasciclin domain-containing protein, partial [Verrucomicrobiales bacterium]|nr:fasciclin domain-containing protein [Verrucomicrobiales bacterium]